MGALQISLFGEFQIFHEGWSNPTKITRMVKKLLAYLLLNRDRIYPRAVLAGIFWGEHCEEKARSCLRTTLCRLRQVLEPRGIAKGTYLVTTSQGEVGFNRQSSYWLDLAVFEETVTRVLKKPIQRWEDHDAQQLADCQDLYTGDLFEGFYEDWALRERERLRSLYIKSLVHLMYYKKLIDAYDEGLACAHRILDCDPLREKIHRAMMQLYLDNGQPALAIRQYNICCKILDKELGIPPMDATQALHDHIVLGSKDTCTPSAISQDTANLQGIVHKLRSAMQDYDKSCHELQAVIRLLEENLDGHKG
jgi:DNA-binding SARP family transcriptional activator